MYTLLFIIAHLAIGSEVETGGISGTIRNQDQQLFPGVHVKLYQDKKLILATFSNVNGKFGFSEIPTGTYELTFDFVGKRKRKYQGINVKKDEMVELEVLYPLDKKTDQQKKATFP